MAAKLEAAPVLSTPDTHILNETFPSPSLTTITTLSDEDLRTKYEIERTLEEIRGQKWQRIALQFPDEMLHDAPRVFQLLSRGLHPIRNGRANVNQPSETSLAHTAEDLTLNGSVELSKLFILADTSYGSCCVDEVAAEHINADAVVHYGRACLSPTARLPVLHVFTKSSLNIDQVAASFTKTFPELGTKVVLTADVTYATYVHTLNLRLAEESYENLFVAEIIHDPSSPIPNRTVPAAVKEDPESLSEWHVFHISYPPTSLLLTLSSRIAGFHIFPTDNASHMEPAAYSRSTAMMLRRRYALVTSLTTVSIWGILINTLSVKNYLHIVEHVKYLIGKAGKKSYMFVVGKLNAAKVANFSEIGGWVVIGCWESSLIDSQDFYRPVITPFELQLALSSDLERVWTGLWRSDFQAIIDSTKDQPEDVVNHDHENGSLELNDGEYDSEPDSEPPEFDLRTGRYVSQSRPMHTRDQALSIRSGTPSSTALTKKAGGDLVSINGTASPGAEFLKMKRTWQGLGSDFEISYEEDGERGSAVQEGRSGVAKGYTVGDNSDRR